MKRSFLIAGMFAGAFAAVAAPPVSAQSLMSCEVIGTRGSGDNVEIVYNPSRCTPVTNREVTGSLQTGSDTENVYGALSQTALGGGPVYVLRFVDQGQGPVVHYGAPLDGNPGTVGR